MKHQNSENLIKKPYLSPYRLSFTKKRFQTAEKPTIIAKPIIEEIILANQFVNTSQIPINFGQRIHSQQASYQMWQEKTSITKSLQQNKITTPVNVESKQNFRRYHSQGIDVDNYGQTSDLKHCYVPCMDPKLKRILSDQSKNNFLQFLLVQKVGQQNEQKMLHYLQNEQNYKLPELNLTGSRQFQLSKKQAKKKIPITSGGVYLQVEDESDQQLQEQVKNIFAIQNNNENQKFQQYNSENDQDPPLDEYIKKELKKSSNQIKYRKYANNQFRQDGQQ